MISGAARLDALAATLEREMAGVAAPDAPVSYMRLDGRLSEAGIAAMTAFLNQGLSNAAIAELMDVDASAVSKRRKDLTAPQTKTA